MNPICFYHSADLDGKCSAAIVHHKYNGDVELCPINYGQSFPWEKLRTTRPVIMVDFSLQPFEEMHKLVSVCHPERLIWIDHHETALQDEAKAPLDPLRCSQHCRVGTAGCELTWEYFFPGEEMPPAVHLLGRYDVWDHTDPDTLPFQSGIRFLNLAPTASEWKLLFMYWGSQSSRSRYEEIVKTGNMILKHDTAQNTAYAKSRSYETTFEGLRAIVCNKGLSSSQLFDSVFDPEKHDVMIAYCRLPNKQWAMKVYSTKDNVHCGELCKKHGGGGHKGAGGFQCEELPIGF